MVSHIDVPKRVSWPTSDAWSVSPPKGRASLCSGPRHLMSSAELQNQSQAVAKEGTWRVPQRPGFLAENEGVLKTIASGV